MKTVTKVPYLTGKVTCILLLLLYSTFSRADFWLPKADFPNTVVAPISFSIGTKGYLGGGEEWSTRKDFWEYDPFTDIWTQKADYGGGVMSYGISFSIGELGYAGLGYDSVYNDRNDFWEYNPGINKWKQKADFGGAPRCTPSSFTYGTKGYVGMGTNWTLGNFTDLWEYDPALDTWTQLSSMPSADRAGVNTFVIGNNAYFAGGHGNTYLLNEFWEYNIITDTWIQKPNLPFAARSLGVSFSICEKGYLGTGNDGTGISYLSDFWEYDAISGNWAQKTNYPRPGAMGSACFIIQNRVFVGVGCNHTDLWNQFYEYIPDSICATPVEELASSDIQLSISPNPANDNLAIRYHLKENKKVESAILDTHGKVVHEFTLSASQNQVVVSLKEFAGGIYFLKVGNEVRQFVVN